MLDSLDEKLTLEIPVEILKTEEGKPQQVTIRPLTVHAFQMIAKASKDDHSMVPLLMVKEGVVDPMLNINQIRGMKVGLVNYLIGEIKKISGII